MTFTCPGGLRAKSLEVNGPLEKDYRDWFWNDALGEVGVLNEFSEQGGGEKVLKVLPQSGRHLLIRSLCCEKADLQGRRHRRYEAFLVDDLELRAMENGFFSATPIPDEGLFEVVTDGNRIHEPSLVTKPVPFREARIVCEERKEREMHKSNAIFAASPAGKVWFFALLAMTFMGLSGWLWFGQCDAEDRVVAASEEARKYAEKIAEVQATSDRLTAENRDLKSQIAELNQYKEIKNVLLRLNELSARQERVLKRLEQLEKSKSNKQSLLGL